MTHLYTAALAAQDFCERQSWAFWIMDLNLVRTELRPLAALKEESAILDRLERKITHQNRPFTKIKPTRPRP